MCPSNTSVPSLSFKYANVDTDSEIPVFERVREVKLIDGNWMLCSCGLPDRMKCPCPHVISVCGKCDSSMFHIRWHSSFQNSFKRVSEALDKLFRDLLGTRWTGANVSKVFKKPATPEEFPLKLSEDLTDEVAQRMLHLYQVAS
jgi:hypothetical protein